MNIAALNKMGASRSNVRVRTGLIQGTLNTEKVQGNPELSGEVTTSPKCAETIHPASQTEEGNVICMLCGLEFKRIMHFHTENKHDMSLQEYRERFPYAQMEGASWLEANRKGHLGQTAWNRGLTKENDQRVADYSASLVGLEKSPEHCRKISAVKKGKQPACGAWNKGFTKETHPSVAKIANNKERNAAIGRAAQARMKDPEYVSRLHSKMRTQQTKPEKIMQSLLDSLFPKQWLFTGDGKIVIDGLVPDFMNINGRKQLIEVFGDYWHRNEDPEERIDHFRRFGYSAVVFWEEELKNKELQASTVERLRNFCKDGEIVRASGKPERNSHRNNDRHRGRSEPDFARQRRGENNHYSNVLQLNGEPDRSAAYHIRNCDNPGGHRVNLSAPSESNLSRITSQIRGKLNRLFTDKLIPSQTCLIRQGGVETGRLAPYMGEGTVRPLVKARARLMLAQEGWASRTNCSIRVLVGPRKEITGGRVFAFSPLYP